jgi:hypothetical protein
MCPTDSTPLALRCVITLLNRAKEDPVPLVDLSVVDQRYAAVKEVLDGATVKETAIRYGSTGERFIAGFAATPTRVSRRLPTSPPVGRDRDR